MQYVTSHTFRPTYLLLLQILLLCFAKRHSCPLSTSSLFHASQRGTHAPYPQVPCFMLPKEALMPPIHKFPVSYLNSKTGCTDYIVVFLSVSAKRRIVPHNRPRLPLPTSFSTLRKLITLPLQALYSRLYYRHSPQTNKQTNKPTNQTEHTAITQNTNNYSIFFPSLQFIDNINSRTPPAQIMKWSVDEWRSALGRSVPLTKPFTIRLCLLQSLRMSEPDLRFRYTHVATLLYCVSRI